MVNLDKSGRCACSKTSGFTTVCCLSVSCLHERDRWIISHTKSYSEEASISSAVEPADLNSGFVGGQLCSDAMGDNEVH